jgi:HTH-type transcriptional regulator/antitoxin HigA
VGVKALNLNPEMYGALCAEVMPKVIENDREFDRMVAKLEELTFKKNLTPEERELEKLLERLIQDYDDKVEIPDVPPDEMVRFFMEQRGLKRSDLVPVLGSRAQVSDVVNGKRGISKAQAKKLAEFFHTSAELFI